MPNNLPLLIRTIADLRDRVARWRRVGLRVALVPTMGNLHAGHLSLASQAREYADVVMASVFVNPLQFGEDEDFDSYPRTLDEDRRQLASVGTDAVFHPAVTEMYPDGARLKTIVRVPALESMLCGQHRDGHFAGVATVVTKLLCLVQPDVAVFGRKDYQQLTLIRQLVQDLNLPVRVVGGQTVREADGLAMSSRNRYLSAQQRGIAPRLNASLCYLRDQFEGGERNFRARCAEVAGELIEAGFVPDYIDVVDAATLAPADATSENIVIAAAAYLGKARLIDNVAADLSR
ncbi:MAG: pantoate--beta-alanine ligase [Gammaproteobacteria bacterium]